jgi:hypothetical protein
MFMEGADEDTTESLRGELEPETAQERLSDVDAAETRLDGANVVEMRSMEEEEVMTEEEPTGVDDPLSLRELDKVQKGQMVIIQEVIDQLGTQAVFLSSIYVMIGQGKRSLGPPAGQTLPQTQMCLANLDRVNGDMGDINTQLARLNQDVSRLDREMSEMRPRPPAAAPVSGQQYYLSGGVWRQDESSSKNYTWADDGRPVCRYCGIVGHVQRKCYHKKRRHAPVNCEN